MFTTEIEIKCTTCNKEINSYLTGDILCENNNHVCGDCYFEEYINPDVIED